MQSMKNALQLAVAKLEEHQFNLCSVLVHVRAERVRGKPDVAVSVEQQIWQTARPTAFSYFVRYLCTKNRGATRNIQPPGLSDNSVLLSAYFVLLRMLKPHLQSAPSPDSGLATFPAKELFLRGATTGETNMYADFPRLGGTLGHLLKVCIPSRYNLNAFVITPRRKRGVQGAVSESLPLYPLGAAGYRG
jgi:Kip1 ubiquitination-promoting complex protein 1